MVFIRTPASQSTRHSNTVALSLLFALSFTIAIVTRLPSAQAGTFPELSPYSNFNPFTLEPWEEYPRGLYEVLTHLEERYHLPMVITETGVSDPNDDGTGSRWVTQHAAWAQAAVKDGVQLRGFYYWSLIDNYEWNQGMRQRYGLYAVDKTDAAKLRTARQTVDVYQRIATANRVPDDLAARYQIDR